jgi:hypothetical protein
MRSSVATLRTTVTTIENPTFTGTRPREASENPQAGSSNWSDARLRQSAADQSVKSSVMEPLLLADEVNLNRPKTFLSFGTFGKNTGIAYEQVFSSDHDIGIEAEEQETAF